MMSNQYLTVSGRKLKKKSELYEKKFNLKQ